MKYVLFVALACLMASCASQKKDQNIAPIRNEMRVDAFFLEADSFRATTIEHGGVFYESGTRVNALTHGNRSSYTLYVVKKTTLYEQVPAGLTIRHFFDAMTSSQRAEWADNKEFFVLRPQ